MVGSMIFLQKLSITPFSAFSINDWTVNMIFITVIGGIGRVEGPILGTVIYFVLREFLADLASAYLIILGVVAIGVMLKAPKGIWGYVADRFGWQLFPLARRLVRDRGITHEGRRDYARLTIRLRSAQLAYPYLGVMVGPIFGADLSP